MTRSAFLVVLLALSCRGAPGTPNPAPSASSSVRSIGSGSIGPPKPLPAPRQGMAFIPGGALVAGTPPSVLPRVAEAEIPGEQIVLREFYIDVFPFPNEDGAIPLSNVDQPQAAALCAERGKRLCSELEWERACKGPDNRVYEYGDAYRSEHCGTGTDPGLRPSGLRVGCRSDFGVRDLHGGVFEWTSSAWGRGSSAELFTVRGGNGTAGEVIGRCANGRGLDPRTKSSNVGFRCCAGEPNTAEVSILVPKVKHLESIGRVEPRLEARLRELIPSEVESALGKNKKPRLDNGWIWRPVPNETLYVVSLCTGAAARLACGVLVARDDLERASYVAFAPSGRAVPALEMEYDPRDLHLYGADVEGSYRRTIAYAWGRVTVQPEDRRAAKAKKTRKEKPKKAPKAATTRR